MIYKNANYGTVENVDIIEFGNGTIEVGIGSVKDNHKAIYLKEIEKAEIGVELGVKTVIDMNPDLVLAFTNKKSFDVFYKFVQYIKEDFEVDDIKKEEENMNDFDTLLEELNKLKIMQDSIDWEECIPDDIWESEIKGRVSPVASGLEVDTRRWYETSITVFKTRGRLMGVKHITNMFSEMGSCEDMGFTLRFFEMEEVPSVTYKEIKE